MYNLDECRKLGRLIQEERKKQGMSQERLAELLGVSRVTVTEMETRGKGLSNIFTRRAVAKALGLSPLAFGALGEDVKQVVLYDTTLLWTSFQLHVENYFTTSTVKLADIDTMVSKIFSISKSLDHKDKDVRKILHGYTWLGIDLAIEAVEPLAIGKYIGLSEQLAWEINDPVCLARTYIAASEAMRILGNDKRAEAYAQSALHLKNTPSHVQAAALLDLGIASTDPDSIDRALTIVQNNPREEDIAYVRLTPDLCQLKQVMVLIRNGDILEAESALADAEESTPTHLLRRRTLLQWLEAELAMKKGEFDQAAIVTLSAIPLAKQINSSVYIERLRTVYAGLLESDHARSQTVRLIGQAL